MVDTSQIGSNEMYQQCTLICIFFFKYNSVINRTVSLDVFHPPAHLIITSIYLHNNTERLSKAQVASGFDLC